MDSCGTSYIQPQKSIKWVLYQKLCAVQMANGMAVLGLLQFVCSWSTRVGNESNQQASLTPHWRFVSCFLVRLAYQFWLLLVLKICKLWKVKNKAPAESSLTSIDCRWALIKVACWDNAWRGQAKGDTDLLPQELEKCLFIRLTLKLFIY